MQITRRLAVLLATAGLLATTMFVGVAGVSATIGNHGISINKGCQSPTKIGDPYTCSYTVFNINPIDSVGDTLTFNSLVDTVNRAPQPELGQHPEPARDRREDDLHRPRWRHPVLHRTRDRDPAVHPARQPHPRVGLVDHDQRVLVHRRDGGRLRGQPAAPADRRRDRDLERHRATAAVPRPTAQGPTRRPRPARRPRSRSSTARPRPTSTTPPTRSSPSSPRAPPSMTS